MPLAVRIQGGQGPEAVECRFEIAPELQGVEALIERLEVLADAGREHARGAEPVIGGLRPVIDAVHVGAVAVLAHELLHGLEEIDVQAGEAIDAGELGIGGFGGEAIIVDERADDGAVLLFDMGAVVLLPGATAGEGDAALPAVVVEALVDELAAVVAVKPEERHGEALARAMHTPAPPLVPLAPDRLEFDPGGGDVDGAEGAQGEALRSGPAMRDEIDFEKAGPRVVPLREGADGDLVAEPGPDPRGGGPARGPGGARGGEQPTERGGTNVADELVELGRQPQLAITGEPVEELGDEGMETMRADVSGGLPQDLHGPGHRRPVAARAAGARTGRRRPRRPPKQADRRLAMEAGDGDDLVQQCPFLGARGAPVPLSLQRRVLPQARSRHGLLPRLGMGNRDFRCTTSCSVTEILM